MEILALPLRETSWHFDTFYTHKRHDSQQLDRMALTDEEYRVLGVAVMARLLALNGRSSESSSFRPGF